MDTTFRDIAVFVSGSTPQVITETLCALALKTPPVIPQDIYVVTTVKGRDLIREHLLKGGVIAEMASDYGLSAIPLREQSIIVPRTADGAELHDIRNSAENECMGDAITSLMRRLTADSSTRLHCSIAGGRKTMGFYLGAALQLMGRPQDKLYHVLVTPEFESNPDFFYKPRKEKIIECRAMDGTTRKLSTAEAEISLAELPFVRLGGKINLHGKDFRELVCEGQREVDMAMVQPEVIVNLGQRTVSIGEMSIDMVPMHLLVYVTFLRQKTEHCRYPERPYCLECTDCFPMLVDLSTPQAVEKMTSDYVAIYGNRPVTAEEFRHRYPQGLPPDTLRQNISRIKGVLKDHVDETMLPYYVVTPLRKYSSSRYGVRVEKRKITIE